MIYQDNHKTLGLYIHWPFCVSKCPYCDFNSHVHRSINEQGWLNALLKTLHYYHNLTKNHNLTTIFFGGGTPSLMHPSTVEKVINTACNLWGKTPQDLEITLEANPNSVEVNNFKNLKQAGVNRVSVGVQSFNTENLKFLGRNHSPAEAIKAIETGIDIFDNFSFDLIYALPLQTISEWEAELKSAMAFNTKHLSLYQLTIEPNTAFYKQYERGDWQLPSHDNSNDMYNLTEEILSTKGLKPYEISNYAVPGFESKHNLTYWRYNDFIGVGPGAHGRIKIDGTTHALKQYSSPVKWFDSVQNDDNPGCEENLPLTEEAVFEERLIMGMRLKEQITITNDNLTFVNVEILTDFNKMNFIHNLKESTQHISFNMTNKGRLVANAILGKLLK
ncbi:MAG TPA: coproporphyrinogen III oxidase [Holosporales bacterium]|nr:coproporphyrinogen III oxidase [Holosporales bacterium]